jgi:hypothetical protein
MISLEELRALRSKRRLTKEEKLAYRHYWQSSKQSQRRFCEQEGLSLATFGGWLKSLSCQVGNEGNKSGFIAVEVQSAKQSPSMALQFKCPNGLVIEGCFSLSEVGSFVKELSNGLPALR